MQQNFSRPAINDRTGHCKSCGRDNRGYKGEPCSDDCPMYWEEIGIENPDYPKAKPYPSFLEFIRARYGRNWVVHRRTARILARYGDDVHCFSPAAYDRVRDEWRDNHPAVKLVLTLPVCAARDFILAAVKGRLV